LLFNAFYFLEFVVEISIFYNVNLLCGKKFQGKNVSGLGKVVGGRRNCFRLWGGKNVSGMGKKILTFEAC
jgi:hypothetical protein